MHLHRIGEVGNDNACAALWLLPQGRRLLESLPAELQARIRQLYSSWCITLQSEDTSKVHPWQRTQSRLGEDPDCLEEANSDHC